MMVRFMVLAACFCVVFAMACEAKAQGSKQLTQLLGGFESAILACYECPTMQPAGWAAYETRFARASAVECDAEHCGPEHCQDGGNWSGVTSVGMDNFADDDDYTVDIRSFLEFQYKLRELDSDFENDVSLDEHSAFQDKDQLLAIAAKDSRNSFAHGVWLEPMHEYVAVIEDLHGLPASEIVMPGSGYDDPQWWHSGNRLMDPAMLQHIASKSGIAARTGLYKAWQQKTLPDVYGTRFRYASKGECWMKGRSFTDDHRMFQKVGSSGFNLLDVIHAPMREPRFGRAVNAEFDSAKVIVGSDNFFTKYGAASQLQVAIADHDVAIHHVAIPDLAMVFDGDMGRYNDPRVAKVHPQLAFLPNHDSTTWVWINPWYELLPE